MTLSPTQKREQKMRWRNEWNLYKRQCDGTDKSIISMYDADVPFPVYEQDYWWSDDWDARDYGRNFDFSRPFFEQWAELLQVAPRICVINAKSENSQYTNYSHRNKNCYLAVGVGSSENVLYGFRSFKCENMIDCNFMLNCQWCYECTESEGLYECQYSHQCENSNNLQYCFDCKNCDNCFGCWNLKHKSYHIFNKPYSKEEYFKKLAEMPKVDRQQALDFVRKNAVFRAAKLLNSENCTGDNMVNSKNCESCFDGYDSEDCAHTCFGGGNKDCQHVMYVDNCELNFESACLEANYDVGYSFLVWYSNALRYCMDCFNSKNLFGCIGMNKAEYCILNKQYTKEEYEALVPKIIEHMKNTGEFGQFFPTKYSPFAYNETILQNYRPLTKAQAEELGERWKDDAVSASYDGPKYDIPAKIEDTDPSICNQILTCAATGKNYRITKLEYELHQKMGIPIPHLCPAERYRRRLADRNPRELFERKCAESGVDILTTFPTNSPAKVVCEDVYLNTIA